MLVARGCGSAHHAETTAPLLADGWFEPPPALAAVCPGSCECGRFIGSIGCLARIGPTSAPPVGMASKIDP